MLRKVKKGERILWEWKETVDVDYPNGVLVYTDSKGEKHLKILMPEEEPHFVTVDIQYKKSTDIITYAHHDEKNRDLYIAKYPNLIFEVRKGNELLWFSKDKKYPYKLLVIYVPNQKPILRVCYPTDQKPLSSEAAPMGKYDGYKREVYQPTPFPVETPDIHTTEVKLPDESSCASTLSETDETQPEPTKAAYKIHVFIEDPKDSNNNIELDLSTVNIRPVNEYQFIRSVFPIGTKCTQVKYKDESIWRFDATKVSKPKSVIWHESYYLVMLEFDGIYKLYTKGRSSNIWRFDALRNTSILDKCKIKLYTKDDQNFLVELGNDKYEFKDLGFAFEYVFKDDSKCVSLKYDEASIYAYDPSHNDGNYPKVLYIFSDRSGQIVYPGCSFPLQSPIDLVLSLKDITAGTNSIILNLVMW